MKFHIADYISNVTEDLALCVPSEFTEIMEIISPSSITQINDSKINSVLQCQLKKALSSHKPKE